MQALISLLRMAPPEDVPIEIKSSSSSSSRVSKASGEDPRMGTLIKPGTLDEVAPGTVVIVGFPHDEGCRRNGGRPGAKRGPEVFRKFANILGTTLNPEFDIDIAKEVRILDVGDVDAKLPLEEAHEKLQELVASILSLGGLPFVVGGSNDQSYPNASALIATKGKNMLDTVGVVNIDAHLDVRGQKNGLEHSGSPFRLLLEDKRFCKTTTTGRVQKRAIGSTPFIEFAAQGSQCSVVHANFVEEKGGKIVWLLKDLRRREHAELDDDREDDESEGNYIVRRFRAVLAELALSMDTGDEEDVPTGRKRKTTVSHHFRRRNVFVSFDVDALTGADAPGVSCPGTIGLTAEEALEMCFAAGETPEVQLFDMSEFNPDIDEYRTGRLVANMFYYFVMGVAQRYQTSTSVSPYKKRKH